MHGDRRRQRASSLLVLAAAIDGHRTNSRTIYALQCQCATSYASMQARRRPYAYVPTEAAQRERHTGARADAQPRPTVRTGRHTVPRDTIPIDTSLTYHARYTRDQHTIRTHTEVSGNVHCNNA